MTPDERRRTGGAVAERMSELGLSVAQLAQKAGLDPSTIRSVTEGRHWPNDDTRRKIANALGWDVGDMAKAAFASHITLADIPTGVLIRELCGRFGDHET